MKDGRPQRDGVGTCGERAGSRNCETVARRRAERVRGRNRRRERDGSPCRLSVRTTVDEREQESDDTDEPHHPHGADTATRQPVNRGSSCDCVLGFWTMNPVEATSLRTSGMDFGSSKAADAGGAPARYLIQAACRASTE